MSEPGHHLRKRVEESWETRMQESGRREREGEGGGVKSRKAGGKKRPFFFFFFSFFFFFLTGVPHERKEREEGSVAPNSFLSSSDAALSSSLPLPPLFTHTFQKWWGWCGAAVAPTSHPPSGTSKQSFPLPILATSAKPPLRYLDPTNNPRPK